MTQDTVYLDECFMVFVKSISLLGRMFHTCHLDTVVVLCGSDLYILAVFLMVLLAAKRECWNPQS